MVSDDFPVFGGEPGVRLAADGAYDSYAAFAPEILFVVNAGYVMYYAGYSHANRAYTLRATSEDGRTWRKESAPVIAPSSGGWDAAKCSEMCVIFLAQRDIAGASCRMLYEACNGTALNERRVWYIVGAIGAACQNTQRGTP